jgi:hypothetical protein
MLKETLTISKRKNNEKSSSTPVPKGATITDERREVRVEEISNGFLLIEEVNKDYTYMKNGEKQWGYFSSCTKTYYTDNPSEFDNKKSLADLLDN